MTYAIEVKVLHSCRLYLVFMSANIFLYTIRTRLSISGKFSPFFLELNSFLLVLNLFIWSFPKKIISSNYFRWIPHLSIYLQHFLGNSFELQDIFLDLNSNSRFSRIIFVQKINIPKLGNTYPNFHRPKPHIEIHARVPLISKSTTYFMSHHSKLSRSNAAEKLEFRQTL